MKIRVPEKNRSDCRDSVKSRAGTADEAESRAMEIAEKMRACAARVEEAILRLTLPETTRPAELHRAMRYSLCAGGKRIRPVLILAAAEVFPSANDALPACVAMECLHTYTLIHDDLPCMDNSDLRRGRPSCHKQFREDLALLAGDALNTHAFALLAEAYAGTPEIAVALIRELGDAAGSRRLIGGQVEDTIGELGALTPERLDYIHANKTAALLEAALAMGFILGARGNDAEILKKAHEIGFCTGIAFQIVDDLLDLTSDAGTLGKPVHADADNGKLTYPALHGIEKSRERAAELTAHALELCDSLGGGNAFLRGVIASLLSRKK